jgi:hypothetical protein
MRSFVLAVVAFALVAAPASARPAAEEAAKVPIEEA